MSEIGEVESPRGAMTTRVDPKLFGKPADFLGDKREWRHFEWVFRNWFGFLYDQAEGSFVDEPRAKSTVLMVICKDDGNLAATVVRTKTDEYGIELVLRFLNNYERVEIKTDGEPVLWRLLDEYNPDETGRRVWHSRVLVVIKRLEQWNVQMGRFKLNFVLIIWTCWIA